MFINKNSNLNYDQCSSNSFVADGDVIYAKVTTLCYMSLFHLPISQIVRNDMLVMLLVPFQSRQHEETDHP